MASSSGTPAPPPPPVTWTPPVAAAPARPLSERFSPESMAARGPWRFLAFLSQALGLLLVFLGTLVVVAFGSLPISCIGATTAAGCSSSLIQGVATAIVAGHLLWTLGLFGLAGGSGLHLYTLAAPTGSPSPEATRIYLARRRGEFALLVVSVGLLFVLMLWSAFSITLAFGGTLALGL